MKKLLLFSLFAIYTLFVNAQSVAIPTPFIAVIVAPPAPTLVPFINFGTTGSPTVSTNNVTYNTGGATDQYIHTTHGFAFGTPFEIRIKVTDLFNTTANIGVTETSGGDDASPIAFARFSYASDLQGHPFGQNYGSFFGSDPDVVFASGTVWIRVRGDGANLYCEWSQDGGTTWALMGGCPTIVQPANCYVTGFLAFSPQALTSIMVSPDIN